jgi:3-oxoacyl-[acyl-carrier-protein] synthase-3
MGIRIVGTGLAAPVEVQTAEQLAPELNRSAAWIGKKAGVPRRHVASPDLDVTDLAVSAARQALSTGASPDLIINASTSARQLIPDSAVFLQRALGYAGIACFSVHATCLSFLVALQISNGLLATGAYQRVLLCSAEIATRGRNFSEPESAALLGDGAAAAVIEWTQTGCGLLHFAMETHPAGAALAEVRGGGLYQHPGNPETTPEDYLFSMDGPALYRTTLPAFQSFLQRFLREATISIATCAG